MILIVTTAFLTIVIVLWLKWRKNNFTTFERLGIPGPKPNIFFGNILELRRKGQIQAQTEWIKKYGKVLGFYYGLRPVLLVADLDLLKLIEIKNFHQFINRPDLYSIVGTRAVDGQLGDLKGQHWKEVRNIMSPAFTGKKMRQMLDVMNRDVDDLLTEIGKKAKTKEEFNIHDLYQDLTMKAIAQTAIGIELGADEHDHNPLLNEIKYILSTLRISWIFVINRSFLEFRIIFRGLFQLYRAIGKKSRGKSLEELKELCRNVVKQRKTDPSKRRGDLLQGLIDAEGYDESLTDDEDDPGQKNNKKDRNQGPKRVLSEAEIIANAILILVAGYETTSTSLAFTTLFLVNHPEIQEKIRQELDSVISKNQEISYNFLKELKYLDQVTKEGLRMCPPTDQFVVRETTEEVQLGQWTIPKEMAVMIPVFYIHHDPDNWEEPYKFDPDRFSPENQLLRDPLAWQAFGAGPRDCIGKRFALQEFKLALAKIFSKYYLVPSDNTEKGFPAMNQGTFTVKPKNGTYVKALSRSEK